MQHQLTSLHLKLDAVNTTGPTAYIQEWLKQDDFVL